MSNPALTGMPSTPHAGSSRSPLRIVSNPSDHEDAEEEAPALSSTASSPSTDDGPTSPPSPSLSEGDAEIFDDTISHLPRNPKLVITPNTPTPDSSPLKSKAVSPLRAHPHPARRLTRLSPLAPLPSPPQAGGTKLGMPKSQPLARTLYARMGNSADVPHAGFAGVAGGKKGGAQKLIVPKKAFKTTFCLDLTASEFARTS